MRGEGQNALVPAFLPAGFNPRNTAEITASTLPFSGYHNSLALREQVRQAMIGSSDGGSTNSSLNSVNTNSNPLAYQMLGQSGLSIDHIVARQNGQWQRSPMLINDRKTDATSRGKGRVRSGVRNDTCQYCGKVSETK